MESENYFLLLLALLNLTINILSVTCLLIERLLGFIGFVNSGNWPWRGRNAQFLSYHLFLCATHYYGFSFLSFSLTHSPLTFYLKSIFTFAQKLDVSSNMQWLFSNSLQVFSSSNCALKFYVFQREFSKTFFIAAVI